MYATRGKFEHAKNQTCSTNSTQALANRFITNPLEPIDLINVGFTGNLADQDFIKDPTLMLEVARKIPDRATGINGIYELGRKIDQKRPWRLIEVKSCATFTFFLGGPYLTKFSI